MIFDVSLSTRRNGGAVGFYVWWEWYGRSTPALLQPPHRCVGVVLGVFDITVEWPNPYHRPLANSGKQEGPDDG